MIAVQDCPLVVTFWTSVVPIGALLISSVKPLTILNGTFREYELIIAIE